MLDFSDFEQHVFSGHSLPGQVFAEAEGALLFAEYGWALPRAWPLFSALAIASGDTEVWIRRLDQGIDEIYLDHFGQTLRFSISVSAPMEDYLYLMTEWPGENHPADTLQTCATNIGWASASGRWSAFGDHDFNTCIIQTRLDANAVREAVMALPEPSVLLDIDTLLPIVGMEFGVGYRKEPEASLRFAAYERKFRVNYGRNP